MSDTNDVLLAVENVSNSYKSLSHGAFGRKIEKKVLCNVSLEVRKGEIFGLVGESGCGKTTLGRSILGLIDYSGNISIAGTVQKKGRGDRQGKLLESKEERLRRARLVQAVFQDPAAALNPVKKTGWLLEEPLRIHKIGSAAEREKRVDEMLDLIGLDSSYRGRKVRELSAGQRQRVCIGCALMLKPALIIADEPVSSLDVSVGAQILNLFRELHRNLSLSMVFISHDLNLVYYLCDRIAVMKGGRIVESGAAEEVYSHPKDPYTLALIKAIPEIMR